MTKIKEIGIKIDDDDLHFIQNNSFCVHKKRYVHVKINGKTFQLHRMIMGAYDKNVVVDHKNGNGLDNRRCNLRICGRAENARNSKKRTFTKSKLKGVYWYKKVNKWQAHIRFNYKKYHLGYFDTKEEAGRVYDDAARKMFGEFARLNFANNAEPKNI